MGAVKKPTPFMREVLSAMAAGWKIEGGHEVDPRAWLVPPGEHVGRLVIHANVFRGLLDRGLIRFVRRLHPRNRYAITVEGREAAEGVPLPRWATLEPADG